ncbi:MAG: holin [Oceanococcaceae bacterium]
MNAQSFDAAAANAAVKLTVAGGSTSALGWLASSEGVAIMGVCCAVIGLATQLVFGIRRDRRESREHKYRMDNLETKRRTGGAP